MIEINRYDSKKDTKTHINTVRFFIKRFREVLKKRGINHDKTKLSKEEKPYFDIYTPKLKNCTYGSDEYKQYLSELSIALKHHYSKNKHHPERWKDGIKDMSLVDIVEMLCDWKAATLRHNDGDLLKSIEINQERFDYSDELKHIMLNEAKYMYKYRIDWGCCDGRNGVVLADDIGSLVVKIHNIPSLTKNEQEWLIHGGYGQREGKEYFEDSITIDNAFSIDWLIQY